MKRLALCLLGTAASALHAADPAPVPDTAGFHLKNRSTFTSPETARPPFWPVGWVKHMGNSTAAVSAAPVAPEVKLEAEQFSVTSILLGHPSLAVINGKPYVEGEYLRMGRSAKAAAGQPAIAASAKIQVQKIDDGVVILAAANQAVSVRLKRPQLTDHKVDEDPLIPVNER